MDLKMPNVDGIEATRRIAADHDSRPDSIAAAALSVVAGERVMASAVANRVLAMLIRTTTQKEFYDGLTGREIEVLKLLAGGMTNKQIAYKLRISEKTVRNRVSAASGRGC